MTNWVLRVQLCGEWEECAFGSRQEALTTFVALTEDYPAEIERAVLLRDSTTKTFTAPVESTFRANNYIN